MSDSTTILLNYVPSGKNGSGTLTATLGKDVLHVDTLNICKASARNKFVAQLTDGHPGLDAKALGGELLRLANRPTEPDMSVDTRDTPEVDVSHIVRPELFHTADVSGLTVPTVQLVNDKPHGQWVTYLRWNADGKRERRKLKSEPLELPGGRRSWFFPVPAAPLPTHRPDWTATARKAWLEGASAPEPAAVFRRICERIAWFLDFPPESAAGTTATLALWVLFTYAYPVWPAVPYLAVGGPLGSGKTTLFRVLGQLCFRPLKSSNMSAACLFRALHERGGTLLLDEAERLRENAPETGELRSVLLSGYAKGSPAMRMEKTGDGFRRCEFDVYGPKAFSAIARLPEALSSRCIHLGMFRAVPNSLKPRRRIDAEPRKCAALRDDLHSLALEHGPTWIGLVERTDVCPASFSGRAFELWQPLLALAVWLEENGAARLLSLVSEYAGGSIAEAQDDSVPDADATLVRLLACHVCGGTAATLKASHVLEEAQQFDPATFGTKERPRWSPRRVGAALKRYGLITRKGSGNKGLTYSTVSVDKLRRIERAYGFELGLPPAYVPQCTVRTAEPALGAQEPGF